jgi:hypothetical protein
MSARNILPGSDGYEGVALVEANTRDVQITMRVVRQDHSYRELVRVTPGILDKLRRELRIYGEHLGFLSVVFLVSWLP